MSRAPFSYVERVHPFLSRVQVLSPQQGDVSIEQAPRFDHAVQRREAILRAVAKAAECFLHQDNWEATVSEVLASLGEGTRVSRIYIFRTRRCESGELLATQQYEWVAEGVEPQIGNGDLQDVPFRKAGFGRWEWHLKRRLAVYGNIVSFPSKERALLEPQNIKSIVVVPIHADQSLWGFMGFDECTKERNWTAPEVDALKAAAGILGSALQRNQSVAALCRRDKILQAVNSSTEEFLRGGPQRVVIAKALQRLGLATESSQVAIFQKSPALSGDLTAIRRAMWKESGAHSASDPVVKLNFPANGDDPDRLRDQLRKRKPFWACDRTTVPQENLSRRPSLYIPIMAEDNWWGFLMFCPANLRIWSAAEVDALSTAANTLGAAIERQGAQFTIRRQIRRLTALREIDHAITNSIKLKTRLDVFLKKLTLQLAVDAAAVLLLDEQNFLKFAACRGFRTRALRSTRLPLGEGCAGRAATQGQTIMIPDLRVESADFGRSPVFLQEGFVTYLGVPLLANGELMGVLEIFQRRPFRPSMEWMEFLKDLTARAAVALDNSILFSSLENANQDLGRTYDATLEGWSRALDLRDQETEGHTQRVTRLTLDLAQSFGLPVEQIINIKRGALLHDIGKLGVPDHILLKPGKLDEDEWVVMRKHPTHAYEMLRHIPYLRDALEIPYCHHEKWDGTGYPRGLKGESIPLAARIFAVADVWDALTSDRPYRKAWAKEKALRYIREQAGGHFDPQVVEGFLKLLEVEE